jgi:peptidoglycan/xylan/chitin deacetylase (PgdA/CDA1 family)
MRNLLQRIYDFLTGRCLRNISFPGENKASVYLTFDDGPDYDCTPKVLELLKRHEIKATFFVIGNKAKESKDIIERMLLAGHSIGNHTIDHNTTRYFSGPSGIKKWITSSEELLQNDLGISSIGFRSPVGIKTPALNIALKTLNMPLILWNVRFYDTRYGLNVKSVKNKLPDIKAGSIILLHDTHQGAKQNEFLKALEFLIVETKKKGLQFEVLEKNKVHEAYRHKYNINQATLHT